MSESKKKSEKEYPEEKPSRHKTVRIPLGLDQAVKDFLETPTAARMGYRHKSDVVTSAVRRLLIGYNFYPMNPQAWECKEKAEEPRE